MSEVRIYNSDDYAGADTFDHSYYYGYETNWKFTVTDRQRKVKVFQLTDDQIGLDDRFDVRGNLIAGMALWGSK
jgi:hypothetical protein